MAAYRSNMTDPNQRNLQVAASHVQPRRTGSSLIRLGLELLEGEEDLEHKSRETGLKSELYTPIDGGCDAHAPPVYSAQAITFIKIRG